MVYVILIVLALIILVLMVVVAATQERHRREHLQAQLERDGFMELLVVESTSSLRVKIPKVGSISAQVVDQLLADDLPPVVLGLREASNLCAGLLGPERARELEKFLSHSPFFSGNHEYGEDVYG